VRTINLTDQQIKRIAIAIAGIILAIVAVWYAWEISTFSSLSSSEAKLWLRASEWTLIIAAILLAIGLAGEWPEAETWKKSLWYKAAKLAVIIGVMGELLGDAGVFEAGDRLESLDNSKIIALETRLAARALTDAQQKLVAHSLIKYEGQPFQGAVATSVADGRALWVTIHAALIAAKWKLVPPSSLAVGDPPAAVPISPEPDIAIFAAPTGDEQVQFAARDLQKALVAERFPATLAPIAFGDASKNPAIIVISIGPKTQ
jgi:hypothetical protein